MKLILTEIFDTTYKLHCYYYCYISPCILRLDIITQVYASTEKDFSYFVIRLPGLTPKALSVMKQTCQIIVQYMYTHITVAIPFKRSSMEVRLYQLDYDEDLW